MKELVLFVVSRGSEGNQFEVHCSITDCVKCRNSIIVVDYAWTPWIRKNGNLLW